MWLLSVWWVWLCVVDVVVVDVVGVAVSVVGVVVSVVWVWL